MKKHNFILKTASVLIFIAAVSATSLFGQNYGRIRRISVWLSGSLVKPQQQGLYSSAYSPPLQAREYTSSASQTLNLKARDASGTSVGISVGINRILNIVFQVDWAVTDLTGVNTPYELSLNYIAMWPPAYTPKSLTYERTMEWANTEGKIQHLSFSLNLQGRLRLIRSIMLDISAGLTYFSLKGDASSLGFDNFWLGGHSALFSDHYRLRMVFGPGGVVGGNMGLGVEIPLIRPIYLYFGGQLFLSPKVSLDPEIDFVLNNNEIIQDLPLEQIRETMNLQPLELNPGRLQILFGVRLRL